MLFRGRKSSVESKHLTSRSDKTKRASPSLHSKIKNSFKKLISGKKVQRRKSAFYSTKKLDIEKSPEAKIDQKDQPNSNTSLTSDFNISQVDGDMINEGILAVVHEYTDEKSFWIIDPDSSYKSYWDIMNFILIIYQAIISPFRIWFDAPPTGFMFYVELIIDIIFILDIFVWFNWGFYKKGTKVMTRMKIIVDYFTSWFALDLLASFPYSYAVEIIFTDNSELSSYSMAPKLLRMLKIIKFLRILKIIRVLKLK